MKVLQAIENTNQSSPDLEKAAVPTPPARSLSILRPFHLEAIRRLIEGQMVKDVARDIGITATHLSHLKNNDPLFKEALERGMLNKEMDVLKRIQLTSFEALDVVRELMRTGRSENIRLQAAQTILDRAGYSKLEKRVSVIADAETIIRELNRRKAQREDIEAQATEVESEIRQDA